MSEDKKIWMPKPGGGVDTLGTKADGLKLDWQWITEGELSPYSDSKVRRPCQSCFAEMEHFQLNALFYYDHYGADVSYHKEMIACHKVSPDDVARGEGPILVSRLQAQLMAESLLVGFHRRLQYFLNRYKFEDIPPLKPISDLKLF